MPRSVGFGFVVGSLLMSPGLKLMRPAYMMGCGLALGAMGLAVMALAVHAHSLIVIVLGNVALSELASELGGALGIALLGSLVTVVYRSALSASVPSALDGKSLEFALHGIGSAAGSASAGQGAHGLEVARTAYSGATQVAFWVAAVITQLYRQAEPGLPVSTGSQFTRSQASWCGNRPRERARPR